MRRSFCENAIVATPTVATPSVGEKRNSETKVGRRAWKFALKNLHRARDNEDGNCLLVRSESDNRPDWGDEYLACQPRSPLRLAPPPLPHRLAPPPPPPPPSGAGVSSNLLLLCHSFGACASPKPARVAPAGGDGVRGAFSTGVRGAFSSANFQRTNRFSHGTIEYEGALVAMVPSAPSRGRSLGDRIDSINNNKSNVTNNNRRKSRQRSSRFCRNNYSCRNDYSYRNEPKDGVFEKTLPLLLSQNSGGHDGSAGGGNNSYSVTIHTTNNNNRSDQ